MDRPTKPYVSAAAEDAVLIKAYPCRLCMVLAFNDGASTVYLQLHNVATALEGSEAYSGVPIPLAAGQGVQIPFPGTSLFTTGLVVAASTDKFTFTSPGDVCWFRVDYL